MVSICLNMIVKNEHKVIKRLMESVCSIIDCYCICDTGSTDDTIEIIETFFKKDTISVLFKCAHPEGRQRVWQNLEKKKFWGS